MEDACSTDRRVLERQENDEQGRRRRLPWITALSLPWAEKPDYRLRSFTRRCPPAARKPVIVRPDRQMATASFLPTVATASGCIFPRADIADLESVLWLNFSRRRVFA